MMDYKKKAKKSLYMAAVLLLLSVSGIAKLIDMYSEEQMFKVLDAIVSGIGIFGFIAAIAVFIMSIRYNAKANKK